MLQDIEGDLAEYETWMTKRPLVITISQMTSVNYWLLSDLVISISHTALISHICKLNHITQQAW